MIDLTIQEKYFKDKFVTKTLDILFYAPLSAYNWNPNFEELSGTYSNDNNPIDLYQKIPNLC